MIWREMDRVIDRVIDTGVVVATVGLIIAHSIPLLQVFFQYGKTAHITTTSWYHYTVPKHWFSHFYTYSLCESFVAICITGIDYSNKYTLVLFLMLLQSMRRIYECRYIMSSSPSQSRIHILHYFLGIGFYAAVVLNNLLKWQYSNNTDPHFVSIGVSLFIIASYDQHFNHRYLASLPKYTCPQNGLFQYSCCAHYFDEVMIYTAMAIVLNNFTSVAVLCWVVVSLSISAGASYDYYVQRGDKVMYRIIPFVY